MIELEQYFNWFFFFGGEFCSCNKNNTAKNIKKRLFHFEISHQKFVKKRIKTSLLSLKKKFFILQNPGMKSFWKLSSSPEMLHDKVWIRFYSVVILHIDTVYVIGG